jgi:hypothetical protein
VRLAEGIAIKTLVPLARLLPTRWKKSMTTDVDTLAGRMAAEGTAAPAGVHIILARQI